MGATRFNVPIRRTNRYQQYYMPSQHTYCGRVWNLIQDCDVQSSDYKVYISTPPKSEECWWDEIGKTGIPREKPHNSRHCTPQLSPGEPRLKPGIPVWTDDRSKFSYDMMANCSSGYCLRTLSAYEMKRDQFLHTNGLRYCHSQQ